VWLVGSKGCRTASVLTRRPIRFRFTARAVTERLSAEHAARVAALRKLTAAAEDAALQHLSNSLEVAVGAHDAMWRIRS
jgi:hypothetical protein